MSTIPSELGQGVLGWVSVFGYFLSPSGSLSQELVKGIGGFYIFGGPSQMHV